MSGADSGRGVVAAYKASPIPGRPVAPSNVAGAQVARKVRPGPATLTVGLTYGNQLFILGAFLSLCLGSAIAVRAAVDAIVNRDGRRASHEDALPSSSP
jgi:hypothetical protein